MPTPIRIVFFGTPAYAVPTLTALAQDSGFDVCLAVTRPDRPSGRGNALHASAVKTEANRLGIPVYQPEWLRSAESREPLERAGADLFLVAAYGLIFGPKTLAIPRLGCLNLHASLLPKYRGASPVSAAVISGDAVTGVSLMVMERDLDTGPVVETIPIEIDPAATTESLTARLALVGATLSREAIPLFAKGELQPAPQAKAGASLVRTLEKADGWMNWRLDASHLERAVRAMWPWPRAWTTAGTNLLQIHRASVVASAEMDPPGTIDASNRQVVVQTGAGGLRLDLVQPAGGTPVTGYHWSLGLRGETVLGRDGTPQSPPPLIVDVN